MFNKKLRGVVRKVQTSVCVRTFIFLSMPEEEIKKRKTLYKDCSAGIFSTCPHIHWMIDGVRGVPLHYILRFTYWSSREWREERDKVWELFIPRLASYRRSMFFRWLILARVHNSRLSSLFPAMASLSTALNLSSTSGMWEKLLKESPRLLSWDRPPSSSGRELRWFPSKDSVCRLQDGEE